MGALNADWQMPTSDWYLAIGPIGNLQSKIGNVSTHPLPQAVLTSCHSNKRGEPSASDYKVLYEVADKHNGLESPRRKPYRQITHIRLDVV